MKKTYFYFKGYEEFERFMEKPFTEAIKLTNCHPKYDCHIDFKTSDLLSKQFFHRLFAAYIDRVKKENYPLFCRNDCFGIIVDDDDIEMNNKE